MVAVLLLSALPGVGHAQSRTIRGVEVPASLTVETTTLNLSGAGVRSRFFFKLYVGALYLAEAGDSAQAIVTADAPMAITLDILSGKVTRERLIDTLKDGFRQSTSNNTAPVQTGIDTLVALMQQEKIVPGDHFGLRYVPGRGTGVSKNDEELAVIEGLPFKQALFGIWLGDKPAQASLKKDMLGE